jgi:RNA polymerase sigma factor (TIGR02999 family)
MSDITTILKAVEAGGRGAAEELLELVYAELRQLARAKMSREQGAQTLQATALVHEAWMRLNKESQPAWENRRHFFGAASEAMRRILIERARRRQALARGGYAERVEEFESHLIDEPPDTEMLAVHEALEEFAKVDPGAAEIVKLRYFVGMSMVETAEASGQSLRQAERTWTFAKAWLRRALAGG